MQLSDPAGVRGEGLALGAGLFRARAPPTDVRQPGRLRASPALPWRPAGRTPGAVSEGMFSASERVSSKLLVKTPLSTFLGVVFFLLI